MLVRMKKIEVSFKRIEMVKIFPKEYSAEIRFLLNDGKDKVLNKTVKLDNLSDLSISLLREVREKVKSANASSSLGDGPLSGVVIVKVVQDEDVLVEKLVKFFSNVREKMKVANQGKMSYYDLDVHLKRMSVEF